MKGANRSKENFAEALSSRVTSFIQLSSLTDPTNGTRKSVVEAQMLACIKMK